MCVCGAKLCNGWNACAFHMTCMPDPRVGRADSAVFVLNPAHLLNLAHAVQAVSLRLWSQAQDTRCLQVVGVTSNTAC